MTDTRTLVPAAIFGDGMILQRDKECRVFGKASDEVTAVLEKDGKREEFKVPVTDGKFVCAIGTHEAGTGYKLTISAAHIKTNWRMPWLNRSLVIMISPIARSISI